MPGQLAILTPQFLVRPAFPPTPPPSPSSAPRPPASPASIASHGTQPPSTPSSAPSRFAARSSQRQAYWKFSPATVPHDPAATPPPASLPTPFDSSSLSRSLRESHKSHPHRESPSGDQDPAPP